MRTLFLLLLGAIFGAFLTNSSPARAGDPLYVKARAIVTRITNEIGPGRPSTTLELRVQADGATVTGGTCSIITAGSPFVGSLQPGSTLNLVVGGK